jgi:transcriptional regulator with XRE-family HTH domain
MDFLGLQENLRQLLLRRIRAGQLSGLQLAREAGLRQPHISNFLNSKRGLSLGALDRVLRVQRLSILDLLDAEQINHYAAIVPPGKDEFETVILVDGDSDAFRPHFSRHQVLDMLKVRKTALRRLRPAMEANRTAWQRFIFLQASAREGMSMYPRLLPGARVLLDRHYNSLAPYRRTERNMYAVVYNGRCYLRYAQQDGPYLILQAENRSYSPLPVALVGKRPCDYIAGRICSVQIET